MGGSGFDFWGGRGVEKLGLDKKSAGILGNLRQTVKIAHSNKCRMNQYFPCPFSEHQLRVSNLSGWIHATAIYTNGTRELREATQTGWIHATPGYRKEGDKADFDATERYIGGVDGKPELN